MDAATTEMPAAEPDAFEWAIVEVFGHRRHAGRAMEIERFGTKLLRIDIPQLTAETAEDGKAATYAVESWVTHLYGGSSIFSYTPTDEASVMRVNKPYAPAHRYIAPPDDDVSYEMDDGEPNWLAPEQEQQ